MVGGKSHCPVHTFVHC